MIDIDGHIIEHLSVLKDFLRDEGSEMVRRFEVMMREDPPSGTGSYSRRECKSAWWGLTARTLDRATCMAPGLLHERLDELGFDVSVLYPTFGLVCLTLADPELRVAACRAENRMNAELVGPYADRLVPVAAVPMHTPDEALEVLRHATDELGFRAAVIPPGVGRPIPRLAEDAFPVASYLDSYGIDSPHDYDVVWEEFNSRGIPVASHGAAALRYLPSGRRSPSNYVFNHVGAHAYQQAELCRALIMGGVPSRFPDLRFVFLESGVSWGMQLLADMVEHWEKRNGESVRDLDPARLDSEELAGLLRTYGGRRFEDLGQYVEDRPSSSVATAWEDEWRASGVTSPDVLRRMFEEQFFFGCEADDRGMYTAFSSTKNPLGVELQPLLGSDIGHWDVQRTEDVLEECFELVSGDVISGEEFEKLTFVNPQRLYMQGQPTFFAGTTVGDAVVRSGS
ncbi:MAG: amidohydrolase family protein [Acidimicrobiia bacterium]